MIIKVLCFLQYVFTVWLNEDLQNNLSAWCSSPDHVTHTKHKYPVWLPVARELHRSDLLLILMQWSFAELKSEFQVKRKSKLYV